jgi:membrane fusion protein (multidrug efflux system)
MASRLKRGLVAAALIFVVVVIFIVAAFNLDAFGVRSTMIRQAIQATPQPAVPVTAEAARTEPWQPAIPAIGTVEAVRGVDVAPQIAGRVVEIYFESGQLVKAGTPLLKLDDSIEQAQLKEAQANVRLMDRNLGRGRELVERGNMSRANYDMALAQREVAQAQHDHILAQIAQKIIAAPFDGKLGIRQVNVGQYLAAGTMIVTLQSQDPIYINFRVPERELPRLKTGDKVAATVDTIEARTFEGTISSIDAKVDQTTRNIAVQATFANSDGALVPGMFANVRVNVGAPRPLVTIPETAVTYSLYGDSVYVVKGDTFERRFVRIADRRDGAVGLAEGAADGEQVITSGQIRLVPGSKVTIDNRIKLNPPPVRPKP